MLCPCARVEYRAPHRRNQRRFPYKLYGKQRVSALIWHLAIDAFAQVRWLRGRGAAVAPYASSVLHIA
eukprot:3579357-Rhodomonas_salina.1